MLGLEVRGQAARACLGLPGVDVHGHLLQLGEAVILRRVQDTLQVTDTVAHGNRHLLPLP